MGWVSTTPYGPRTVACLNSESHPSWLKSLLSYSTHLNSNLDALNWPTDCRRQSIVLLTTRPVPYICLSSLTSSCVKKRPLVINNLSLCVNFDDKFWNCFQWVMQSKWLIVSHLQETPKAFLTELYFFVTWSACWLKLMKILSWFDFINNLPSGWFRKKITAYCNIKQTHTLSDCNKTTGIYRYTNKKTICGSGDFKDCEIQESTIATNYSLYWQ